MDEWQLSAELEELERTLAGRQLPEHSADLRQRVLGDVWRRVPSEQRRSRWRFAVTVAAGVMFWLNLSLVATHATDCGFRTSVPGEPIETTCEQIEKLCPELSPREARRQAILLRAGTALVPCPDLSQGGNFMNRAHPLLLDERREERSN